MSLAVLVSSLSICNGCARILEPFDDPWAPLFNSQKAMTPKEYEKYLKEHPEEVEQEKKSYQDWSGYEPAKREEPKKTEERKPYTPKYKESTPGQYYPERR